MKIDYLGHSGFLAETNSAILLFDYYRGDLSILENKPSDKPLFVFASHAHGDHFNPAVFSLQKSARPVKYVLAFDIQNHPSVPESADVLYAEANKEYRIECLGRIRTLLSNDEGVAFFIDTEKETLFHAGDLNRWDWTGEDPVWLAWQKDVFTSEIQSIKNERIDVAFLVLDDRLEGNYALGMTDFLSVCRPSYALPMHFWKDRSVVKRFCELPGAWKKTTAVLDTANETHWEI